MLRVRLTPRASRDAIEGLGTIADGTAILARVRAVPEKGAANAALERLVAHWLDVPASAVSVTAGGKSRVKSVELTGSVDKLRERLAAAVAALPRRGTQDDDRLG